MKPLEHFTIATPAYDKRSSDPSKDYGIHGVELRWIARGKKGAVQFVLLTNWQLPHVRKEIDAKYNDHYLCHPIPADLGYHSKRPRYPDQFKTEKCEYLDGATCYYDGSGLAAERIYQILLTKGSEGIWAELDKYYSDIFGVP